MGCGGSKAAKTNEIVIASEQPASKTLLASLNEKPQEEANAEASDTSIERRATITSIQRGEDECKIGPRVPLRITILSARGLRNADCVLAGKSDPYCICEVVGKPDAKVQTHTVADQLNPEWNYECEDITTYNVGDSLTFTVKDEDPIKPDDFLGTITLTADKFFPNGFEGEAALLEAGDNVEAFLNVKITVLHPIVKVTIVGATNLRNADWVGTSDPYCVCEVVGKQESKFETPYIAENLNPEWQHEAEVIGFQVPDTLVFTVKDKDPLKPDDIDDILGNVSLSYQSFCEAGFDDKLQLLDTAEGLSSFLKVKVVVGEKQLAQEEVALSSPSTTGAMLAENADEQLIAEAQNTIENKPAEEDVTVEEHSSAAKTCFC